MWLGETEASPPFFPMYFAQTWFPRSSRQKEIPSSFSLGGVPMLAPLGIKC